MNGPNSPPPTVHVAIVLSVLLLIGAGVGLALADSGYDLDVPGSIDTPEQTVTVEGDEYDVDAIASYTAGEQLDVDVTMPDDDSFRVDLYNSDRQVEEFRRGSGSERVTFKTDDLTPGSYVLALSVDSNHVELHPVVIEAYDVSLVPTDDVDTDDDLEVTVEVTEIDAEGPPAGVEVAVWNGETVTREEATEDDDGMYTASFPSGEFDKGTYEIYAVAQGSDTVDGEPEVLGVSDQGQVTVSEPDDDDENGDDETGVGGDDENGDDETDDDENESDDGIGDSENETDNGVGDSENESDDGIVDSENESDTSDESDTEDDADEESEEEESDEAESESDSVIEPNQEEESDTDDEDTDSVPLYAHVVILSALLGLAVATRLLRE